MYREIPQSPIPVLPPHNPANVAKRLSNTKLRWTFQGGWIKFDTDTTRADFARLEYAGIWPEWMIEITIRAEAATGLYQAVDDMVLWLEVFAARCRWNVIQLIRVARDIVDGLSGRSSNYKTADLVNGQGLPLRRVIALKFFAMPAFSMLASMIKHVWDKTNPAPDVVAEYEFRAVTQLPAVWVTWSKRALARRWGRNHHWVTRRIDAVMERFTGNLATAPHVRNLLERAEREEARIEAILPGQEEAPAPGPRAQPVLSHTSAPGDGSTVKHCKEEAQGKAQGTPPSSRPSLPPSSSSVAPGADTAPGDGSTVKHCKEEAQGKAQGTPPSSRPSLPPSSSSSVAAQEKESPGEAHEARILAQLERQLATRHEAREEALAVPRVTPPRASNAGHYTRKRPGMDGHKVGQILDRMAGHPTGPDLASHDSNERIPARGSVFVKKLKRLAGRKPG